MPPPATAPLGIIAGQGALPLEVARAVRATGRRVVAVAFRGFAREGLADAVDEVEWVHVGQVQALLDALSGAGVREVACAGGIPKEHLFAHSELIRPDARALALLGQLDDRGDDAILRAVGSVLEEAGFRVQPQDEVAPELLATAGPMGATQPSAEQLDDLAFAWPIAKTLGTLDVGQSVVVRDRTVLALEAIEGTDAAIRRGAALGHGAVSVVKVLKPHQDRRFDFPTIGAATVETLRESGAGLLAVEAGCTFVVEREELVKGADAAGICLLGVAGTPEPVT